MEFSCYSRKRIENVYEYASPMLYKLSQQANSDAELLDPQNYAGHIIESGVVLCIDRYEVLLISKKGQDVWFTPSSHIASYGYYGGDVALKAINEITGLSKYDNDTISLHALLDSEVDVCTILVPENSYSGEPQHYHIEFRYIFDYNGPKEINIAEGFEYKWVSMDDSCLNKIVSIDKIKKLIKQPRYTKVLLNIMHSSPEIPDWDIYKYQAELRKKIFNNTAWFTDRLFGSDQCYSFVYPYSRYYYDAEFKGNCFKSHKDFKGSIEYCFKPNPKDRFFKKLREEDKDNVIKTIIAHDEAIEKEYEVDAIIIQCDSFNDDDPNFKGVDIYISCQSRNYDTATFKTIKSCFSQWRVVVEREYYDYSKSINAYEQMFTIKVNKRLYMDIVNGKPMYRALSEVRKAILDMYDKLLRRPLTLNDYAQNCMSEQEIMAIRDDDISSVYADGCRWGAWYRDKLLIEAKYKDILNFHNGLAAVELDGKYGYIDKMGRIAIPAIYNYASLFRDGIALVYKDGWILLDVQGEEITYFNREYVDYVSDGVFSAREGEKWGYINAKDEKLTEFIYDEPNSRWCWQEIKQNGKYGIQNRDFNVEIECIYDSIHFYSNNNNIYCVQKNNKYGFVNIKGEIIVPIIYDLTDYYHQSQHVIIVRKGKKYGAYSFSGEMLFDTQYDRVDFTDDVFVLILDKKYGIANKQGKILITPTYDFIGDFEAGISVGFKDGICSIINREGEILVDNITGYDKVYSFCEGMAIVVCNNKLGFIDTSGELVIPLYDEVSNFKNGLASVGIDGLCGYINKNNEVVVDLKYATLGDFKDGYAEFTTKDGRKGKIDMQGNEICSYQDITDDDFRVGKFGV